MSNRICHACISFLNSWQSFKNRCNAAQKKQQTFLDIFLAKERAKKTVDIQMAAERQRQLQTQRALASAQQQRILKTALTQSMNSTPYNTSNNSSVDVVCFCSFHIFLNLSVGINVDFYYFSLPFLQSFIKEEPEDVPSDLEEEIEGVDPTQFLAQDDDDDGASGGEDQPPILTSLGLTHINHVNAQNCLVCLFCLLFSFRFVFFRLHSLDCLPFCIVDSERKK